MAHAHTALSGIRPPPGLLRHAPGVVLLVLCIPGWFVDRTLFWAVYLAAWWFCAGLALGGLANVWIHNLTGGEWGEAIRDAQLAHARALPLLALLFVPLLFALHDLYPWAAGEGVVRWQGELSDPRFKSAWLAPWFFTLRSAIYLAIWVALERISRLPRYARSQPWSAAALLIYWASASLAAIDWLMSLVPLWHSSAFPPLAVTGQMLAGFAAGTLAAAVRRRGTKEVYRDLGNLMLVYVLCWAYLAFTQYLIIWAANLPHEIGWYVMRRDPGWAGVAWLLAVCHFFLPLLILLSRDAKEAPRLLGALAAGLLAVHLVDVWWLIVPSVRPHSVHVLWLAPLASAALLLIAAAWVRGSAPEDAHG